jgi:hypothetical protein
MGRVMARASKGRDHGRHRPANERSRLYYVRPMKRKGGGLDVGGPGERAMEISYIYRRISPSPLVDPRVAKISN